MDDRYYSPSAGRFHLHVIVGKEALFKLKITKFLFCLLCFKLNCYFNSKIIYKSRDMNEKWLTKNINFLNQFSVLFPHYWVAKLRWLAFVIAVVSLNHASNSAAFGVGTSRKTFSATSALVGVGNHRKWHCQHIWLFTWQQCSAKQFFFCTSIFLLFLCLPISFKLMGFVCA